MRDTYGSFGAVRPLVAAVTCLVCTSPVFAQATPAATPSTTQEEAHPQAPDVSAPPETTTLAPVTPGFPEPAVPAAAQPTAPPALIEAPLAAPPPAAVDDPNFAAVSFKPGKGVDIKSKDGNFSLNIRLKSQLLYEANKSESLGEKLRQDFYVRRVRLALAGNVFSKNLKYKAEVTFAAAELGRQQPKITGLPMDAAVPLVDRDLVGQVPLLDLYFDITHLRDLSVRVGQSKVPFGRERILSDNEMIAVDRSLEDKEFNFDRDMGIDIRSGDFLGANLLHYYLGVYMAEERNAAPSTLGRGDLGLLYNARVELVPFGNFDEVPVDFERGAPKLSIGVAYAFLQTDATSPYATQSIGSLTGKLTDPSKVDYNAHNFTADALFKAAGFSLMTAFHMRKVVDLPAAVMKAHNGLGWVVQAGYLLANSVPLEIAANFGLIRAVTKEKSNIVPQNELGVGFNYYFNQHAVKLQAEVARIWFEDAMVKKNDDTRVRVQFQVLL